MRTVIGIMGGADADAHVRDAAHRMGRLVADNGWVLLTGGRNSGVMAAASQGASEAGGLVVGILPGDSLEGVAAHVDIAVPTGMGDARNAINVLASRVVVVFPGGAGTLSEVALALKSDRPVVTVGFPLGPVFSAYRERGLLFEVDTVQEAISAVNRLLKGV